VTQNELEFLTLIFVFRIPEDGKGGNCPRMETRSIGLRTLEIVVSDFDNPYGCGTAEPVSVAANGRNGSTFISASSVCRARISCCSTTCIWSGIRRRKPDHEE
jgi:hypothetical protein